MASITPAQPLTDPPSEDGLRIERVGLSLQREALGMLLAGRPDAHDPAVEPFLTFSRSQKLDLTDLWAVWRDGVWVGTCLIVPSPGRTAMLFLSPPSQPRPDPPCDSDHDPQRALGLVRVVQTALAHLDPAQVQMVQCLLNLEQADQAQTLIDAGLTSLASLFYMSQPTPRSTPPAANLARELKQEQGLESIHWSEKHRPRFADAILSSYEQTRDCPGLLGLRTIDDIIAGHMATGTFDPTLWWALYQDDQPVGVMLLGELAQQNAGELVYLGLSPRFRGQGLSRRLLEHGLAVLGTRHIPRMLLAVDRDNQPAVALYRSLGFAVTHQKAAFIFSLQPR